MHVFSPFSLRSVSVAVSSLLIPSSPLSSSRTYLAILSSERELSSLSCETISLGELIRQHLFPLSSPPGFFFFASYLFGASALSFILSTSLDRISRVRVHLSLVCVRSCFLRFDLALHHTYRRSPPLFIQNYGQVQLFFLSKHLLLPLRPRPNPSSRLILRCKNCES